MSAIVINTRFDTNRYRNASGAIPVIKIERVNSIQLSVFLSGTKEANGFSIGTPVRYAKSNIAFEGKIINVQEGIGGFVEGQPFTVLNVEVGSEVDTNAFNDIYDGTISINLGSGGLKVMGPGTPVPDNKTKMYVIAAGIVIAGIIIWRYRDKIMNK